MCCKLVCIRYQGTVPGAFGLDVIFREIVVIVDFRLHSCEEIRLIICKSQHERITYGVDRLVAND